MFQVRTYHTPILKPSNPPKNPTPIAESRLLLPPLAGSISIVDNLRQNPEYYAFNRPDPLTRQNLFQYQTRLQALCNRRRNCTRIEKLDHDRNPAVIMPGSRFRDECSSPGSECDDGLKRINGISGSRQNVINWLKSIRMVKAVNGTLTPLSNPVEIDSETKVSEDDGLSSPGSTISHLLSRGDRWL